MTACTVKLKNDLTLVGIALHCQHILKIGVSLPELLNGQPKGDDKRYGSNEQPCRFGKRSVGVNNLVVQKLGCKSEFMTRFMSELSQEFNLLHRIVRIYLTFLKYF